MLKNTSCRLATVENPHFKMSLKLVVEYLRKKKQETRHNFAHFCSSAVFPSPLANSCNLVA